MVTPETTLSIRPLQTKGCSEKIYCPRILPNISHVLHSNQICCFFSLYIHGLFVVTSFYAKVPHHQDNFIPHVHEVLFYALVFSFLFPFHPKLRNRRGLKCWRHYTCHYYCMVHDVRINRSLDSKSNVKISVCRVTHVVYIRLSLVIPVELHCC